MRALLAGAFPTPSWVLAELRALAPTYLYLAVATTTVFAILGWIVGSQQDLLDEKATTDGLTGLANRRHFDARLRAELGRARRYGTPLALVLVDVDNLKKLNAEGGHEGGDEALRAVGETIAHVVRADDLGARVGGDEFAVITPMTAATEALEVAERIRRTLRERRPGRFATPTVSIGISEVTKDRGGPASLFAAADRALYLAKERGRDRAVLAEA